MIRRNARIANSRNAKNYSYKVAQDRLQEVMPVVKSMVENSAIVNSAPIMYFSKNTIGRPCSCQTKSQDPLDLADDIPNENSLHNTRNSSVKIRSRGMIFGDQIADLTTDIDFPKDASDRKLVSDTNFILRDSIDCGVCYRTGVIPGYSLIGAQSTVVTMSSGNIAETNQYTINTVSTPEVFVRLNSTGYVKVTCSIPQPNTITKFYYSIRNNKSVIFNADLYDANSKPIRNKSDMLDNTTKVFNDKIGVNEYLFTFYVKEKMFTHVVIHALTYLNLYANISDESLSLDYNTINTLSNITLTIPSRMPKVSYGDLIYIPKRNLTLRISDFTRKNTVDFTTWEYTVTTRQIQPQETLISLPIFDQISML